MANPFLTRLDTKALGVHGRRSERRVVKAMGATPTPASGSLQGAKGDATLGKFRMELKSTTNKSIGLELAWMEKIAHEAQTMSQIPGVVVSFVTPEGEPRAKTNAEWVMIPRWAFLELIRDEA